MTVDFQAMADTAKLPKSSPATDKVLYRWHDMSALTEEDRATIAEANLCEKHSLPFLFDDKQWRITFVEEGNEDCFEIEGVEWV